MEINTAVTFRPDIDGPRIPTYTMLTGDYLRNLYIARQHGTQIVTWVADGIDPACVPAEEVQALLEEWMSQAESVYPGEGDYRVRLLDEEGERITIGSVVEFIVEEEQLPLPVCEDPVLIPVCPTQRVVIQICNENSITDDNFAIYLNDTYIGFVDLSANDQVGSIFIADLNPALTLVSSDFACPLNLMQTFRFDPSILKVNNVLEMRNIQDNGSGNAGSIGIRNYELTGDDLSTPCVITDLEYIGDSGLDFFFNFNYTQCCQ